MENTEGYFNSIMGGDSSSFLNIFKSNWEKHIQTFPERYVKSKQLNIGTRFRPLLLCWGYVIAKESLTIEEKNDVSRLAIYLELLHKATLLIDDLIDDDSERNGVVSFHSEYSNHEAVLFAIFLLGNGLNQLVDVLEGSNVSKELNSIVKMYAKAIQDMSQGVLEELTLEKLDLMSISNTKRMIELQTIALVKNGLLTGYKFGNGPIEDYQTVENIGYDCGYIFQVLNDLEPFSSRSLNMEHKGKTNSDFERSRKNAIVPFIVNSLQRKEKRMLEESLRNNIPEDDISQLLYSYYSRNQIIEEVLENLLLVRENLLNNFDQLDKRKAKINCIHEFTGFINHVFKVGLKRFNPNDQRKLSKILIA